MVNVYKVITLNLIVNQPGFIVSKSFKFVVSLPHYHLNMVSEASGLPVLTCAGLFHEVH